MTFLFLLLTSESSHGHLLSKESRTCDNFHYNGLFAIEAGVHLKEGEGTHRSCILHCLFLVKMIQVPVGICFLNISLLRSATFS